ncbi:MAG: hypothetical protein ABSB74_00215 [Tepidisphaeraceae bacterium]
MKIGLICAECVGEAIRDRGPQPNKRFVDVQDNGIYKLTCPKGHSTNVLVQDLKHELLFEYGAIALIDGYSREAVVSFMASVERLYEFIIRVLARVAKTSQSDVEKAWKGVDNKSEQQLGAVIFLYLTINGKHLPIFNDKERGFRNKVVHKGYIPTSKEATDFGEYCLQHIIAILNGLSQPSREALREEFKEHVRRILTKAGAHGVPTHHLRQPFIQTHAVGQDYFGKQTLQEMIDAVAEAVRPDGVANHGTSL